MVAACRLAGQSAQEACNTVAALLDQRYVQWEHAMGHLPSWDVDTDVEVRRYIQGIQDTVQANISWRQVFMI